MALLSESRVCARNGAAFRKDGFLQYNAAWDSKHNVEVEFGKTAVFLAGDAGRRDKILTVCDELMKAG